MYKDRYLRNGRTITRQETEQLHSKKIFVAGCGGLGGYIIEMAARAGVGHIAAADPDVFEESNLNRQLLSSEEWLGKSKTAAAAERVAVINSEITFTGYQEAVTEHNGTQLCKGADLIIDALDSVGSRLELERCAENLKVPLIHGAIAGWSGQISTVLPGQRTLRKIYSTEGEKGAETELGNPSFTPAVIAGMQVAEAIKVLLGKNNILSKKLLFIDLLTMEQAVVDFK